MSRFLSVCLLAGCAIVSALAASDLSAADFDGRRPG